jgi:hypothetical protein
MPPPEDDLSVEPPREDGFRGTDMIAVLAVSALLASIGLLTFYLTTSIAS